MNPSLVVPLLAVVLSVASGSIIAALNPRERANQSGTLVMGCIAWWAFCEVMWKQADNAGVALVWHRAAGTGFVFLGPHAALFLVALHRRGLPAVRRVLPACYGVNVVFLALTWWGPWMLTEMRDGPFGWHLVPGPLLSVWLLQTIAVVTYALAHWVRVGDRARNRTDSVYTRRIAYGAAAAAIVAGISDIVLPTLGIHGPRVGSLAVSLIGPAIVVTVSQLGISPLNAAGLAQRILRILPDGVALVRPSGRIRAANPSIAELLGCDEGAVEGRRITDHVDLPVLDSAVEFRAQECELLQDSGFRIPVSISTTPIRLGGSYDPDVLLIVRDVREVAALRNRLATTERLAVVGQLAGGIAHEINNPLAFIRANLNHLQRESASLAEKTDSGPSPDPVAGFLEELEELIGDSLEGVERAMGVVRDVTIFSDAGGDLHCPVDLREPIEHALRVARLGVPPAVRVEEPELPPDLEIVGSPQHLKQLFLNLLVNAVRAVGDRGSVGIHARRDKDHVTVSVRDDGCGIPSDQLSRIFFPFFTTQPVGSGPGLGLAVCHEIVRSHGGVIDVTSESGEGTCVEVTFPARTEKAGAGAV